MTKTARSASEDVLREALEEIREMDKVNTEVERKCEKMPSQLYTCVNGHVHLVDERPAGIKLGSAAIKQPCPLYKQKASVITLEAGEDDLISSSWSTSTNEKPESQPKWKRTRGRNVRKLWACVLAVIIVGLLTTLVVFSFLIKRDEYGNGGQGILTPPLVAPGVIPASGQSVYKLDDGSLFVCGHSQGQYTCQVVHSDA